MAPPKELLELQELDWTIADREKSLADVRAKLADSSAIATLRRRVEQLESQLEGRSSVRRDAQFSVQQLEEKLQDVEKTLYGGSLTNPRELEAYQRERNILQGQLREAEDRLLEVMVEVEEIQSSRDEARRRLQELEAQREVQNAELLREQESLERELAGLRQTRESLTPRIPPAVLPVYESLLKTRNGQAVARVDRARGICQGCRIAIPAGELQRARTSSGIVQCGSCRRILFVE